jgi:hypothetical protein
MCGNGACWEKGCSELASFSQCDQMKGVRKNPQRCVCDLCKTASVKDKLRKEVFGTCIDIKKAS